MDLSPKTVREVEFREKKIGGYHPEDVDQFLEQLATGIDALQDRLRQTTERAVHAEELAAASGESDDALRRTLVLAQRTADLAVQEARAQAAQIVEAAETEARGIVEGAQQQATTIATDAQRQLREDIEVLEAARAQLLREVSELEQWIEEHRAALGASLTEALRHVEQGVAMMTRPPETGAVEVPPPPGPMVDDAADEAEDERAAGEAGEVALLEGDDLAAVAGAAATTNGVADPAGPPFDQDESAGPEIVHDEHDPFMVELRRAVTDEEPLGPRDDDEESPALPSSNERDFYDDDPDARRFGSRLRRRR
jgi:cell division initiation protein